MSSLFIYHLKNIRTANRTSYLSLYQRYADCFTAKKGKSLTDSAAAGLHKGTACKKNQAHRGESGTCVRPRGWLLFPFCYQISCPS